MAGNVLNLPPSSIPSIFATTARVHFVFVAGKEEEKMQIQVKCNCGEGNCSEWAIVEVQGVVEVQPSFKDRIENLEIGRLCRSSSEENYTFTIGYHELSGSKVKLKKPFLVLKKNKVMVDSDNDRSNNNSPNSSLRTELEVIGIIRHRILFKTRPKALISTPQLQVKEKKKISAPTPIV